MPSPEPLDLIPQAREHLLVLDWAWAPEIPEVLHALAQEDGGIAVMRRCPKVVLKVPRSFRNIAFAFLANLSPVRPMGFVSRQTARSEQDLCAKLENARVARGSQPVAEGCTSDVGVNWVCAGSSTARRREEVPVPEVEGLRPELEAVPFGKPKILGQGKVLVPVRKDPQTRDASSIALVEVEIGRGFEGSRVKERPLAGVEATRILSKRVHSRLYARKTRFSKLAGNVAIGGAEPKGPPGISMYDRGHLPAS